MRDAGNTEVGGFGICSSEDLLRIEDFRLVPQTTTSISVVFDDAAVADFYDEQVDAGLTPQQFGRIWIHTHPGACPLPSRTDEETFARAFGAVDWSVMFILAKRGATYARLKFAAGPGGALQLPVEVDYSGEFKGSDHACWQAEFQRCVHPHAPRLEEDPFERRSPPPMGRWDVLNDRSFDDF